MKYKTLKFFVQKLISNWERSKWSGVKKIEAPTMVYWNDDQIKRINKRLVGYNVNFYRTDCAQFANLLVIKKK